MAGSGRMAFPFHVGTDGAVQTVEPGTDADVDQAIVMLVQTTLGERPLAPGYGIPDPAFNGVSAGDLQVGLDEYGPAGITIDEVTRDPQTQTTERMTVRWSRDDDEDMSA